MTRETFAMRIMNGLETALLMAFDPYTNSEIKELLISRGRQHELDLKKMQQYYKIPVMCLLRIKASIDTWEKNAGTMDTSIL